ncbi:hypothetical protein Tco_1054796 [Tanacetum coccineum]|uniref:Uncharacterized protein n=1 Tax=Tanacetum coccineum TaxID=301880 RepID=A0ABQ5GY76_9ASTR
MRYGPNEDGILGYRTLIINFGECSAKEIVQRGWEKICKRKYKLSSALSLLMSHVAVQRGGIRVKRRIEKDNAQAKELFTEFSVTEEEGLHKGYEAAIAPTHSAFIGTTCSWLSKAYYVLINEYARSLAHGVPGVILLILRMRECRMLDAEDKHLVTEEVSIECGISPRAPMKECLTSLQTQQTYASFNQASRQVSYERSSPPAVGITTLPESDVEDPNSLPGSPSFSCSENVKSPRIICNKSGMNNRNMFKNNYVRVKKCFVCGSKLHLIKDCNFYNCVDSVPCKSQAASVPAGSSNSSASVTADGYDPAASRNKPAVNSAGRPKPTDRVRQLAGWSKRPAPVSAGGPVSAGWLNPAARPYFRPSSVHFNNMYWPNVYDPLYMTKGRWGTAVKTSAGRAKVRLGLGPTQVVLMDFVIKGGIVKFGGGDGRISGKGTIRTSKLDFENVYFVEETAALFKSCSLDFDGFAFAVVFMLGDPCCPVPSVSDLPPSPDMLMSIHTYMMPKALEDPDWVDALQEEMNVQQQLSMETCSST